MTTWRICLILVVAALTMLPLGCANAVNHFREDGPSVTMAWDSPTAADVQARYQPAAQRTRTWEATTIAAENGAVEHWPLYFEDPFVDKGDGRTDETDPHNVYRAGWEDYVAMPYGLARFTANWLLFPVSVAVTPPWTVMESDGQLSRQLLGYDHDATPVHHYVPQAPPAATAPPVAAAG